MDQADWSNETHMLKRGIKSFFKKIVLTVNRTNWYNCIFTDKKTMLIKHINVQST